MLCFFPYAIDVQHKHQLSTEDDYSIKNHENRNYFPAHPLQFPFILPMKGERERRTRTERMSKLKAKDKLFSMYSSFIQ